MNLQDFQNLDPNSPGTWPAAVKVLAILALCAAVLGAGYHFFTKGQLETLEQVEQKEGELRQTFDVKQRKAASLPLLKEQLAQIQEDFGALLRRLPDKTEIEALLVDISQAGLGAGLEFELFEPADEQKGEFIATLPISMAVTGSYNEFGQFISEVAQLRRVVTQHDINVRPAGQVEGGSEEDVLLRMSLVAKTYRYLEEDEEGESDTAK